MENEKVKKIVNRYREIMISECKPLYKEMLDLNDEDFLEAWVGFAKVMEELKESDWFYEFLKRSMDSDLKELMDVYEEIDATFDELYERYINEKCTEEQIE